MNAGLQTFGRVSIKDFESDQRSDHTLARLLLNYKEIPYTTEWIDLADIKPTLESYGVKPNPPQTREASVGIQYSLPTIRLPDKHFVMDSLNIALDLESLYPEPSLHLDQSPYEDAQSMVFQCALPLFPEFMPRIRDNLITDHSKSFWIRSRENLFGMAIDEFERTKGGEQAWRAAEPGLKALSEFLNQHKKDEGPFTWGSQLSYADLVLVAFLESTRRTSQDMFDRIMSFHSSIQELYKACGQWLEPAPTEMSVACVCVLLRMHPCWQS